jgi:hypothetical protein
MVRARRLAHLKSLQTRFPELASAQIAILPGRDYRYRLIAPKQLWSAILTELSLEQEWSNFKNEVARYQGASDSGYVHALHEVWSIMRGFQDAEPGNARGRGGKVR